MASSWTVYKLLLLLLLLLLALVSLAHGNSSNTNSSRKNILFIVVDNLRPSLSGEMANTRATYLLQ